MSVRYRLGVTRITQVAQNQWGNWQGDADATILPIEPDPSGAQSQSYSSNDQRRWQIGSVGLIPNLLLSTLAVVAVALPIGGQTPLFPDQHERRQVQVVQPPNLLTSTFVPADTTVLRSPTYQQGKTAPATYVVQPPNLLTSTLAATVVPAPFVPLQQASLLRTLSVYADTSRSSALSLVAVVPSPIVVPIQLGPQAKLYQPANTSFGTAKTLTQDAQLPFQILAQTAPDYLRPVTDTTQKQPVTLQVIVLSPPFVPAQWPGVQRYPSLPADTTHGQINPDAQAPVGESAAWAPIALVRNVVDTTQKQPITLQVIVLPPPITNLPNYGPVRFFWQPADSSLGTSKTLTADAQLPFQILAQTAPDRTRPVTDTSQKQPITLQVIVPPLPIVNQVLYAPVRFFWQPDDTSAGTAKVLVADAQLPFRTQFLQPQSQHRIWAVFNTSQSTPVELFPAVVPSSGEYAYTFIGV